MNLLFQRIFVNARKPFPKAKGNIDPSVSESDSKNDLFMQLLYLKETERSMWNFPIDQVDTKLVNSIFYRIHLLLPPDDLVDPSSEAAITLRNLKTDLRSYQTVMIELVNALVELGEAQKMMEKSANSIQSSGELANNHQNEALERGALLILYILTIIIVIALSIGFSLAIFYMRRVRKEEELREAKDLLLRENRKLLNDIINNSSSIIYVKDLKGMFFLIY